MNVQVAFIVYLLMDLLICDVITVEVFTKFVPNDPKLKISGSSIVYCDGLTVSWDIYCVGYDSVNQPGVSQSKLVFQRPGSTEEVELATVFPNQFAAPDQKVIPKKQSDDSCLEGGEYLAGDTPNIDGQTDTPYYIKYQFSGCKKEHAGVYNCTLKDVGSLTFSGSIEPNGPFTVTFEESACKSDSATDPTGNNASKPTGYPVITLVGIVTITMIN